MVRLARVVTVAALALAGSLVAVTPASAATVDITCTQPSSNLLTFTPPLTLASQPTTIVKQTSYKPCQSPVAPNVTSGTSNITFSMLDDCTMVMLTGPTTFTILWNTGQTTTVSATRTPMISGSTLIVNFTGTVTAGLFLGHNVKQQFVGSATELIACLNGTGRLPALKSSVSLTIFI